MKSQAVVSLVMLILVTSIPSAFAQESGSEGGKSDRREEVELVLLRRQARSGDAKAQVKLGIAYASGSGVAADESEAVNWFQKAAEQGDAEGEYALGEMYATGRGVSLDYVEARKWMQFSADQGHAQAQSNLAAIYKNGPGVEKDDKEAIKWMRKAADQGLAAAQFGMGSMYAHGDGVPQDVVEAIKWYRKAAEQDDPSALNNLALQLATSKNPKIRNTREAIALATRALDVVGQNPAILDTLATAYFEGGQYRKAAETEQVAVSLDPEKQLYKQTLEKYAAAAASQ